MTQEKKTTRKRVSPVEPIKKQIERPDTITTMQPTQIKINWWKVLWQYIFLFTIFFFVGYMLYKYGWSVFNLRFDSHLSGAACTLFALAIAFTWVEVLRWGSVKPFNCIKCLTGWINFILAYCFMVDHWYFYIFVGLLVGALFERIKMRYL